MWTVKSLPLPGVCLNAIFPNSTELPEYLTTMSAMLLLLNSIFPILLVLEVRTPQDAVDPPDIVEQPAGCASVLVTKHARPMRQMNIESRFATAILGDSCSTTSVPVDEHTRPKFLHSQQSSSRSPQQTCLATRAPKKKQLEETTPSLPPCRASHSASECASLHGRSRPLRRLGSRSGSRNRMALSEPSLRLDLHIHAAGSGTRGISQHAS